MDSQFSRLQGTREICFLLQISLIDNRIVKENYKKIFSRELFPLSAIKGGPLLQLGLNAECTVLAFNSGCTIGKPHFYFPFIYPPLPFSLFTHLPGSRKGSPPICESSTRARACMCVCVCVCVCSLLLSL